MDNKCIKEDAINLIADDVKEIKKDVKSLIKVSAKNEVKAGIWGGLSGLIMSIIGILGLLFGLKR